MLDDFDLIVSSFQSQYGLRLSRELPAGMKWAEFASLLSGLGPDATQLLVISDGQKELTEPVKYMSTWHIQNIMPESGQMEESPAEQV